MLLDKISTDGLNITLSKPGERTPPQKFKNRLPTASGIGIKFNNK